MRLHPETQGPVDRLGIPDIDVVVHSNDDLAVVRIETHGTVKCPPGFCGMGLLHLDHTDLQSPPRMGKVDVEDPVEIAIIFQVLPVDPFIGDLAHGARFARRKLALNFKKHRVSSVGNGGDLKKGVHDSLAHVARVFTKRRLWFQIRCRESPLDNEIRLCWDFEVDRLALDEFQGFVRQCPGYGKLVRPIGNLRYRGEGHIGRASQHDSRLQGNPLFPALDPVDTDMLDQHPVRPHSPASLHLGPVTPCVPDFCVRVFRDPVGS